MQKMRWCLLVCCVLTACGGHHSQAKPVADGRLRPFKRLLLQGSVIAHLQQSSQTFIHGDVQRIEQVQDASQPETLILRALPGQKPAKLTVSGAGVTDISARGQQTLQIEYLKASSCRVVTDGDVQLTISGQCKRLSLYATDAASIHADHLLVDHVSAHMMGSGLLSIDAKQSVQALLAGTTRLRQQHGRIPIAVSTVGDARLEITGS